MRVNKFVLDTNIWTSYIISGHENFLVKAVIDLNIEFYYCDELLTEISRILTYDNLAKLNINIKAAVTFIKEVGIHFTLTYPLKEYIKSDADDNFVIALALQSGSGFVTSGDKDILHSKEILEAKHKKLQIITKREFETIIQNRYNPFER